ncbi:MAG: glycosyltransferase [Sulfuritalea sp.]|nr:glycosyltransferase [Sulfuritalea sp.]
MLSVIIPSRDRAELLQRALLSLCGQSLPQDRFEVLVIDNGSSDGTAPVVAATQRRSPNVRYFFEPRPGLHAGRHRGLKEAAGDVLVFADDDIRATPDWLAAIAENFADPAVAMVGGNNYPDFLVPPPAWLEWLWRQPSLGGQAISMLSVLSLPAGRRAISPLLVWGCNFSIRRQVLLDAGGFHPDAMPPELIRFRGDGETHVSSHVAARGLRCVFDSRASVYHAVPAERMTVEYFRKRAYNQGISDSYTQLRAGMKPDDEAPRGVLALARRIMHGLHARVREFGPQAIELGELRRAVGAGRQEGLVYHRMAYRQDEEVRDWVHKADYF